jgi:hypothetical protein
LRSQGFISKRDVPAPGAGLKTELRWLGGRASIARGGPKCRRTNSKTATQSLYLIMLKTQRKKLAGRKANLLILRTLVIVKTPLIRSPTTELMAVFVRPT